MHKRPLFLLTDPSHFDVSYEINPWMRPEAWSADPDASRAHAIRASAELVAALRDAGAEVEMIAPVEGLPDLVFPANAAVVLDGRALLARFRHPERQGEEAVFDAAFAHLKARGLIDNIVHLQDGLFQEGAGDCIWDNDRQFFWAGHGPRSSRMAIPVIERVFDRNVVPLELVTERFYHLDTCFCPLAGGALLYYPPAFSERARKEIRARVPASLRIEASDAEAEAFCVNAVNLGDLVIMARAPKSLADKLAAHGFRLREIDLSPFMLSGGAAYCMTLRLDRGSMAEPALSAAE